MVIEVWRVFCCCFEHNEAPLSSSEALRDLAAYRAAWLCPLLLRLRIILSLVRMYSDVSFFLTLSFPTPPTLLITFLGEKDDLTYSLAESIKSWNNYEVLDWWGFFMFSLEAPCNVSLNHVENVNYRPTRFDDFPRFPSFSVPKQTIPYSRCSYSGPYKNKYSLQFYWKFMQQIERCMYYSQEMLLVNK